VAVQMSASPATLLAAAARENTKPPPETLETFCVADLGPSADTSATTSSPGSDLNCQWWGHHWLRHHWRGVAQGAALVAGAVGAGLCGVSVVCAVAVGAAAAAAYYSAGNARTRHWSWTGFAVATAWGGFGGRISSYVSRYRYIPRHWGRD
jgi:hypothetical protein